MGKEHQVDIEELIEIAKNQRDDFVEEATKVLIRISEETMTILKALGVSEEDVIREVKKHVNESGLPAPDSDTGAVHNGEDANPDSGKDRK